jgi:ubiquinone/menaquinone biosynthesis C-methylase UbiE
LPYCDGEFDLVFLCSVFTHMMPAGVTNYSHEIARVLKPGGRCVVTYFLLNDDNLKRMVTGKPVFNFSHPFQGCRVLDAANPTQAVALPEAWVREAWRSAGMRVAEMTFGFWPGAPDVLGALQDMVIVVKPGSA